MVGPLIYKARYVGRNRHVKDLLIMLGETRRQDRQRMETEILRERVRIAQKIRETRTRAKRLGTRAARLQAEQALVSELSSLHKSFRSFLRKSKDEYLNLALRVAEEVLGANVSALTSTVTNRIERELKRRQSLSLLCIEVHPDTLEEVKRELAACGKGHTVQPNTALAHGEARLVTAYGHIHIGWKQHLDYLRSQLLALNRR